MGRERCFKERKRFAGITNYGSGSDYRIVGGKNASILMKWITREKVKVQTAEPIFTDMLRGRFIR
jgi:hypothetical protein